jgi:PAS domain S-box-containing protein
MSIVNPLRAKRLDPQTDTVTGEPAEPRPANRPFDDDLTGRFLADAEWRVIESNPSLIDLLGHRPGESVAGQSLVEYVVDPLVLYSLLARARIERRAGPVECRIRRADGVVIDASCVVSATADATGTVTVIRGQLLDVSEQRRLQMQLGGEVRMELFGRFAGGLAHDFNNLLFAISGNAQRLARELPAGTPLHLVASEICDASERATSLTHQLLAFSRRQVFELESVDMHRLVEGARPALEQLLGPAISLRVQISPVPSIHADPAQLQSVLTNLATNAREAMAAGGTLTLGVDDWVVVEPPAEKGWLRPGRYVRLRVTDTGGGMDATARARAFHPFFSTKGLGNGRGLGLAMVYGIVKQSRGFVWVDSEPGRGAAFTLLFPASDRGAGLPVGEARETILLVEPDDSLRAMISEVLRTRGYVVLAAGYAEEALRICASRPADIELVVAADGCDAAGERPLLARLRTVHPSIQILVMGSSDAGRTPGILPTTPFIGKPFTLKGLANQIRTVLDSGEGRG